MGTAVRLSLRVAAIASLGAGVVAQASAGELPRTHITLASAISVDATANTVVLPLHRGTANGKPMYYILTESSDKTQAYDLGLNFAPNLGKAYVQKGTGTPNALAFAGAPDFSPTRVYAPSATGFPPADAKPGAIADEKYFFSPYVRLADGTTLGAPIVATGDGAFDVATHADTQERLCERSARRR